MKPRQLSLLPELKPNVGTLQRAFRDLVEHDVISKDELAALIARRPERYKPFQRYLRTLPA